MAFTYVTGSVTGRGTGGGTSASLALHQTPGAGNLLLCQVVCDGGGTASISDTNNGSWIGVSSPLTGTGTLSSFKGQFFYVATAVAAATTVNATVTGGTTPTFLLYEVVEYSYTGGTLSFDGTPVNINTTAVATVATSGAVVTSGSSSLVVAATFAEDGTSSPRSPYTLRDDTINGFNTSCGNLIEDNIGVTAGIQVATVTTNGATDNVMIGLVAFKTGASNMVAEDDSFNVNRAQSFDPVVTVWQ